VREGARERLLVRRDRERERERKWRALAPLCSGSVSERQRDEHEEIIF
jgi:hypothetical protein